MTQQEMTENNVLIAKFMGWVFDLKSQFRGWYNPEHEGGFVGTKDNHFLFHESWDMLMPVVEKIENETTFIFNIFKNECWLADKIYRETASGKRIATKSNSKINSVYDAVVQFIKWHNQNNPQ